jgi:aldose 1-epimerase
VQPIKISDFDSVRLYTIKNKAGSTLRLTNYGATVTSLSVADRHGKFADVVLGYASLEGYLNAPTHAYLGATIGRVANRVAKASFTLGGKTHRLSANHDSHHLHGGARGYDSVAWGASPFRRPHACGVKFSHFSPHGDQGFPGNLRVEVSYSLSEDNALSFEARAVGDQATPVNLCNHNYYNLAGEGRGGILGHQLWINADRYTPMGKGMIPTGRLAAVQGTPLDFRQPKAVGRDIESRHPQMLLGHGYDHNFVLNKKRGGKGLSLAARLYEPESGRLMEVSTSEPGLQFYSGNFLRASLTGKSGRSYPRHAGLCLETQHFPDSLHHPRFPSIILRPGHVYRSKTTLRFSAA